MRALGPSLRRCLDLDAADPAARWADFQRPEDVAALRRLAAAMMADIGRKRLWRVAWRLASRAAYGALYRPFGHYVTDSDHLAQLAGHDVVAPADMAGLQRLYTLSHAGCSSVMAWDEAAGRMVHFRSLDWPSAEHIADATRIVAGRRGGREVYTAAGILGMVGVLTAVKPGFSVCINYAPWRGPSCSLNVDPSFLLRRLMDSPVDNYADAAREISGWRPAAPVFISLCGVARGEACIFEFGAAWHRRRCHAIAMDGRDWLIQTNHFAGGSPFAAHTIVQAPHRPWDHLDWDQHSIRATSRARHRLLDDSLRAGHGVLPLGESLRRAFARRPVWNRQTAQWVEMVPATGEMQLWARAGDEAGEQRRPGGRRGEQ